MRSEGPRLVSRRRAGIRMAALALGGLAAIRGVGRAGTIPGTMLVEEDWALTIGTPDPVNHAPGVKMIMSTQGDLLGYSADYSINFHKEGNPATFAVGGFGIEICSPDGSQPVSVSYPGGTLLNTVGEAITWTQRLKLKGGSLTFSLQNGQSTTWGSNPGEMLSVSANCSIADLSAYDPNFSAARSGPVWWPDRVTSLVLSAVRYYDKSGKLLFSDPTDRVAYP